MDVYKYALPPTIKNYVEARAIKNKLYWCCWDNLEVKSTWQSCRTFWFSSKHLHGGLQHLKLQFQRIGCLRLISEGNRHTWYTCTHAAEEIQTHKIEIHKYCYQQQQNPCSFTPLLFIIYSRKRDKSESGEVFTERPNTLKTQLAREACTE